MNRWTTWSIPAVAVGIVLPGAVRAATFVSPQEAQKILFAEATAFEPATLRFTPSQRREIEEATQAHMAGRGLAVWRAKKGEEILGYFVIDHVIGKHELIDYAVGLDASGTVLGIEILVYRESYGGEVRSRHWRAQFVGKKPKDSLQIHEDIDGIGGATLSSRHVTEGVRKILYIYDKYLRGN